MNGRGRARDDTSPQKFSASDGGRCRPPGYVAHRRRADLSVAPDHADRAVRAGGPVDTLARIVAERMRISLGQPVIIENVTGAGGSIGVGRVARAAPDGYTLIIGICSTHVFNGAIYALPYDVLNDFEPVALLANNSAGDRRKEPCRRIT